MAKFITELDAALLDDDRKWYLKSPLIYRSNHLGLIEVPAGFQTDFASVPRLPIVFDLFGDRAHRESVLHDLLFCIDSIPQATFMQANRVFLEAMEVRGKPWHVRWPMYLAVCSFSRLCYHRRRVGDKI